MKTAPRLAKSPAGHVAVPLGLFQWIFAFDTAEAPEVSIRPRLGNASSNEWRLVQGSGDALGSAPALFQTSYLQYVRDRRAASSVQRSRIRPVIYSERYMSGDDFTREFVPRFSSEQPTIKNVCAFS